MISLHIQTYKSVDKFHLCAIWVVYISCFILCKHLSYQLFKDTLRPAVTKKSLPTFFRGQFHLYNLSDVPLLIFRKLCYLVKCLFQWLYHNFPQLALNNALWDVILSAAKNLRPASDRSGSLGILRCAQNDMANSLFHGLLFVTPATRLRR